MKTASLFFILIAFFNFGFFLLFSAAEGETPDIVITEIQAAAESGHEWIEIYNRGETPVDFTDWKFWENDTNHGLELVQGEDTTLQPGEFALVTQDSVNFLLDFSAVTSTIFDSSWQTLNEGGEEVGIKNNVGEFVEQFTYIPAPNFSLERIDSQMFDYSNANWQEHPSGATPGEINFWDKKNGEIVPGEEIDEDMPTNENEEVEQVDLEEEIKNIFINEFLPISNDGESEWVELWNANTSTVDLTGWTLEDGVGKLVTITSTLEAGGFLVFEFQNKLNNGGDILSLKNPVGESIDKISFGSWDDGNILDNAILSHQGNTLARRGSDSDNDSVDLFETTTPTKGAENTITPFVTEVPSAPNAVAEPTDDGNTDALNSPLAVVFQKGDVVINEIVSDPPDGEVEFVEMYNRTDRVVDLSGWYLEDGSESKTNLQGNVLAHQFFVVENPKGSLNNSGDRVVLFSPMDVLIDEVAYGVWDDGNKNNNAPLPKDPYGLARKSDGEDSDNDGYDFLLTDVLTKGKPNIMSIQASSGTGNLVAPGQIVISEIYPNPPGADGEEEFIELFNAGSETVSLTDFKLSDSGLKRYTVSGAEISPGQYLVFKRKQTGIALNNTGGDEVKLFAPGEVLLQTIFYTGSVGEKESYARRDDDSWGWTEKITPGSKNSIVGKKAVPIIALDLDTEVEPKQKVVFDASDTTHPEGRIMKFYWDFGDDETDEGDVVEHTYEKEGKFTVQLKVVDEDGQEKQEKAIITVKKNRASSGSTESQSEVRSLIFSEIYPNPVGSDTQEFIELFNPTLQAIDIGGVKIDDEEGGSRAYSVPEGQIILPGGYFAFTRAETKLALNNSSDAVRLLLPDGEIFLEAEYDAAEEGLSYIFKEGEWFWTETVTEGKENIMSQSVDFEKTTSSKTKKKSTKRTKIIIETTLEKLREEDVGDKVKVTGVVTVAPGILGSQYFYIGGAGGIQVYLNNKKFPEITRGDRVEVIGEIAETYGETRLKVGIGSDIVALDHPGEVEAQKIEISDIGENFEGQLVAVQGEITELKSSYLFLDDGTEETKVYFKRGATIDRKVLSVGQIVKVTGIVGQTTGGYQILPRGQADIEKIADGEGVPLGEVSEPENTVSTTGTYLTATAGGVTSIALGFLAKNNSGAVASVLRKCSGVVLALVRRRR